MKCSFKKVDLSQSMVKPLNSTNLSADGLVPDADYATNIPPPLQIKQGSKS